ncbi:MAG: nucleotide exchange factor GrpE [Candidatus Marinimicrobia bacterium]|nr:nucleotide exchange factor GrpE [Candidatus Neomarinimicrobiota bacterium]
MPKKSTTTKPISKKTKATATSKEINELKELKTSLNEKITELESDLERGKDKNIRLLAEFDNYKRRTRDEKIHLMRYSGEEIVLSLLPALDDIQRTVDNAEKTDEKSIKEAINLVHVKLAKILKEKNIETFKTVGKTFDPELHEALMSEPGEEDDIIVKEFESGYKYHDRIIRHAKVVVSKIV